MYPGDPGAPGSDFAGVVIRYGPAAATHISGSGVNPVDLASYNPGQAVFGLAGGCLGSHVIASSMALAPLPACISFEAAATTPTVFITTDAVLRQAAGLQQGEKVLLPAAAGGVGLAALQEVASLGGSVVATAGGPQKRAYLRALGIRDVSNSRDISFVEDSFLQSGGVDVVLNTLTSPGLVNSAAALLKPGGRFIEIGKREVFSTSRLAQDRPDVAFGYVAVDFLPEAALHIAMQRLSNRLATGKLRPLPSASHSIANVVSALRQMSQARHVGKVVVSSLLPPPSSLASSSMGPPPPGGLSSEAAMAALGGSGSSVLIVGGTGTLGLLIAAWIASSAAASSGGGLSIDLLGRSGRLSDPSALPQLIGGGLGLSGSSSTMVTVSRSDAATSEDAADASRPFGHHSVDPNTGRIVNSERGGIPSRRLSAVFHAGGVLSDSTLGGQSLVSVRRVFGPKVSSSSTDISLSYPPLCMHSLKPITLSFPSLGRHFHCMHVLPHCTQDTITPPLSHSPPPLPQLVKTLTIPPPHRSPPPAPSSTGLRCTHVRPMCCSQVSRLCWDPRVR